MELTPDERERIYEEEKARQEARAELAAEEREQITVLNRPPNVKHAVTMLLVSIGLGGITTVVQLPQTYAQLQAPSGALDPESAFIMNGALIGGLVGGIASLGLLLFLIHRIAIGRNWARITYLVLTIVGLPCTPILLIVSLASAPVSGVVGVVNFGITIVACVFLFRSDSSAWFKQRRVR